jgi:hypothetical protein
MNDACALTASSDARVAALGQGACISGATAALGTATSCGATASRRATSGAVSLDQAKECASAFAFDAINDQINDACFVDAGASKRADDCDTVTQKIFAAVSAACPAVTVSGDDAEVQLSAAKGTGSTALQLDQAVTAITALPSA